MFKKLKQKLNLLNRVGISFIAAISILGTFLPVFVSHTEAQTRGPAEVCEVKVANFTSPKLDVSKSTVGTQELFDVYFEATVSQTLADQCNANGKGEYRFSLYLYNDDWTVSVASLIGAYTYPISFPLQLNGTKFQQKVTGLSLAKLFEGTNLEKGGADLKMYAYWHKQTVQPSGSEYIPFPNGLTMRQDNSTTTHPVTGPDPFYPGVTGVKPGDATLNNNSSVDFTTIKTKIVANSTGAGLRDKYRVIWTDGDLNFGKTAKLDGVHMEWDGKGIQNGQFFTLPAKNDTIGVTYDPYYTGSTVFFNFFDKLKNSKTIFCKVNGVVWTNTDCSGAVFREADGSEYGAGAAQKPGLPNDFEPVLKKAAWQKGITAPSSAQAKDGNGGKPLGTNEFGAIPGLIGSKDKVSSSIDTLMVLSGGGQLKKFTVEVYATIKEVQDACRADMKAAGKDEKQCDDANFARFGFGDTITQTTNPTEAQAATAGQTLYAFLVRVISDLIILLQSWIYRIFAYIVVPVLNALLKVRPYQDTFVNIIYPGWLILRNLANIFFIVSLLVVGLRILFQQSAAGTARSFIMRLIIMALLVNFSLVIGQGLVAIADTVQSQFLPADSRVIEALGSKLMVEPLKAFRSEVAGNAGIFDSANSELALADTIKPIVLLMLSVASFFSFVAVAAFLTVRLVALWVLYMLSPIAYVGFVMDETKKYASQWWSEFLKYAILTPVLVFFLNIAALMATVFSGQDNSLFKFSDSLSGDIVVGSLTILTHFIVLIFIFAGMKFALSSGTIGSKAIVNAAQKAATGVFKLAGKGVSVGAGYAGNKAEEKGYKGLAKAITVAANPIDTARTAKKAYLDKPREKQKENEQRRLNNLFGLENDTKMGKSLAKARELMKEMGDTPEELRETLSGAYKKKDHDKASASMMKMAQEGQFKEMLEEGGKLAGKDKDYYGKDAAGLNKMTEDMEKSGVISKDQRRDLLNEFNNSAKKKKKHAQYTNNLQYDGAAKANIPRDRTEMEAARGVGPEDVDRMNLSDENSWIRGHIKGRTGDNPKGVLKSDLKESDTSVSLVKNAAGTDSFHMAQIGVFAEQTEKSLSKSKTWDDAEDSQGPKIERMRNIMYDKDGKANNEGRTKTRQQFVTYFQQAQGKNASEAAELAGKKMNALEQGLTPLEMRPSKEKGNKDKGGNKDKNEPDPSTQVNNANDADDANTGPRNNWTQANAAPNPTPAPNPNPNPARSNEEVNDDEDVDEDEDEDDDEPDAK